MSYSSLTNAQHSAAIATTVVSSTSDEAKANRAQARLQKKQADEELRKLTATAPTAQDLELASQQQSNQLELAVQEQKKLLAQNAKSRTYDAFQRYEADGSVEHLNRGLKDLRQNSVGANLFPKIARLDQVTQQDTAILQQLGLSWEQFNSSEELKKGFLKAIDVNGNVTLTSIDGLAAGTGYAAYRTQQEQDAALTRSKIYKNMRAGLPKDGLTDAQRQEKFTTDLEYKKSQINKNNRPPANKVSGGFSGLTQDEAEAMRSTALARPEGVSKEEWQFGNELYERSYQQNFEKIIQRDARTKTIKEREKVRETKSTINEKAGSSTAFFELDFSKSRNRLEYENDVQDILKLGGIEFSNKDTQALHHVRELTALSNPAGDLSTKETGILDNLLYGVKKYVTDNTDGVESRAAYGAFRNTIRHALYGSALTASEISAFNEQFATTGQQLGPLLAQFKINVEQVKHKLESITSLNDSYVSHFYLGKDKQELVGIINALDERIEYFDAIDTTKDLTPRQKELNTLFDQLNNGESK